MKAAWRIIEEKKPWITLTCFGTHVLSLELKDMAKIAEVAAIVAKVQKILNRFWGKKRWARKRLREVAEKNHRKKIGLYRAKATRFAGKVKEMARCLRLKNDLQEVVSSYQYAQQQFGKTNDDVDSSEEDDEGTGVVDGVKMIVLDEQGFWGPLTRILRLCSPIVSLLRLMDGQKPCIGKIYDRMFMVGEHIEKLRAKYPSEQWLAQAAKYHADRWEYLHSPMHAAAYSLDPEFLSTVGDRDQATQDGLLQVIERICLRDIRVAAPVECRGAITLASDEVQERVGLVTSQLAQYQQQSGNFSKKYVLDNAKVLAPAVWWDTYARHLPELTSVAKRVLAQPASASAAERNWSVYGSIKNDKRTNLGHMKADKRVFSP